jgi:hypothetical protein
MAAYDEIIYSPGEPFQNVYDKVNDTFVALKAGTTGKYLVGQGVGNAPVYKTGTLDINIGDWNMQSASTKAVAHGMADYKKIRVLAVTIRDDNDSVYSLLNNFDTGAVNGWVVSWDSTNINLIRPIGSDYNAILYNATSFNRGFITIFYAD